MSSRTLYVCNKSDHVFTISGINGTDYQNVTVGKSINNTSSPIEIGKIEEPRAYHVDGFWGCIYLEDTTNKSQIELFCYVDPMFKSRDNSSIGWKSWNCESDRQKGARIRDSEYLKTSHDEKSFLFTIEKMPENSYMFNMGRYCCDEILDHDIADHVFVIVRKYDGTNPVFFDCYGGHGESPSEKQSLDYCRVSCRGDEDSLRLAKAICCFNPNDNRTEFNLHSGGKLINGDSSGILYGWTGVCHQMANRIFAAGVGEPETVDALDFADVRMGNTTHNCYGPWGLNHPVDEFLDLVKKYFSPFAKYIMSPEEVKQWEDAIKKAGIGLDWVKYFEQCRSLLNKK